jgi:hypothetical protein
MLCSTLLEETTGNSVSRSISQRVYPFSMDNGVPLNCRWFGGIQTCSTSERWPGLYEIPVWNLWLNKTPYSMDYGTGSNAYALLKANFDAAYAGNRAPLPIFIHEQWLKVGRCAALLYAARACGMQAPNGCRSTRAYKQQLSSSPCTLQSPVRQHPVERSSHSAAI